MVGMTTLDSVTGKALDEEAPYVIETSPSRTDSSSSPTESFTPTENSSKHKSGCDWYYDYPGYYRWVYLVLAIIGSFATGPGWLNWIPVASILQSEGAYGHLCPSMPGSALSEPCIEQENAIGNIVVVSTTVMFVVSFFGGIILDCFGTKITTLTGLAAQLLGWILLGASGPNFNAYLAGFVCLAAGNDPIFFGLLPVAHLFPGWLAVVISLLGAARSLSFAIFLAMDAVWTGTSGSIQLSHMSFFFAAISVAWVLCSLWFLPFQPFPKLPEGVKLARTPPSSSSVPLSEIIKQRPSLDYHRFITAAMAETSSFVQVAFSIKYVPLVLVACVTLIRSSAYSVATVRILPDVGTFYGTMGPLAIFPCVLMGFIADWISTSLVIAIVALCGGISMGLGVFEGSIPIQYISVFFNWFFICFLASQFYCFVTYSYPQQVTGRLAGFALACGGLASLIVIPIQNAVVANKTYNIWYLCVLGMCLISVCMAAFLFLKVERPYRAKLKAKAMATAEDSTI